MDERTRRTIVGAAGQLGSAVEAERTNAFDRITSLLKKEGMRWEQVFEAGLPAAGGSAPPKAVDESRPYAAASTPGESEDHATGARRLSNDEIPMVVSGRPNILHEQEWRGGTLMTVELRTEQFVYGPMIVFEERSQKVLRDSEGLEVFGRVQQPTVGDQPVLHSVTAD